MYLHPERIILITSNKTVGRINIFKARRDKIFFILGILTVPYNSKLNSMISYG